MDFDVFASTLQSNKRGRDVDDDKCCHGNHCYSYYYYYDYSP